MSQTLLLWTSARDFFLKGELMGKVFIVSNLVIVDFCEGYLLDGQSVEEKNKVSQTLLLWTSARDRTEGRLEVLQVGVSNLVIVDFCEGYTSGQKGYMPG